MSNSIRDLDPAFKGAGQKAGLEIWRIENFNPVPIPQSSYGKFYTGDSYVILKTTGTKSGALLHDIHYWLGKDTSQDEAGAAAIKTVELDAALGGRAVQYREVQGHETEKFLSYFKPCIIPQEGGAASGFKHVEAEEHKTRLFVCRGKHVVHVKEVPFARSSLSHDDIFILDTDSKIFQFNGSNSSIQERAKALEVVQYIKDTYHGGKCDVAAIEDGRLMSDSETGEFWGFFGGFAPLPRKTVNDDDKPADSHPPKLLCVEKGKAEPIETDSLTRELLDTNKCYIVDCGLEVFAWLGRNSSLDERKSASGAADELVSGTGRSKSYIIRVIEGFETVMFKSKFDSWPHTTNVAQAEDGRGKVAALLKRQGLDVKGLLKTDPGKEEPQAYIDCTGHLQVWRVNGQEKVLLPASDQSKFYSGDCYIFQYSYPGEDKEEHLIGTWIGNNSVEDDRASALSMASKMVESMKFIPSLARIYEGSEPIQFHSILQSFIVYKGGLSDGYKNYIVEKEIPDETYSEEGIALFRIQGSGPENMQAIQTEPVASSLNSAYCYILHDGPTVFSWSGSFTTANDQELIERMLDLIKPDLQCKLQKEGAESEKFWEILGGKTEYPSQKIVRDAENDPHLFYCNFSKGELKVKEIYNFSQDDLMTEDIFILDIHSEIFVWVGQQIEPKNRLQALTVGEKFLEHDFLLEKVSRVAPIYVVMEGSEPPFFTRFFKWESAKSAMLGNSFQRKLTLVKNGGTPPLDKPKRRASLSLSLNSAYCYILHDGPTVFSWSGSFTTANDQELIERMLDLIKPDLQCKLQKEGAESEKFWEILGGKTEYPSQKIVRDAENDPHLFYCNFSKGELKVKEVYNFSQDDLMTEDIFILDIHSEIFVWVGQQIEPKSRLQALTVGEKFLEHDFLLEKVSRVAPIYVVMEGSEPPFFTRFFKWESAKSAAGADAGNSFQRKLTLVKNGGTPPLDKPKRRASLSYGGRSSSLPEKSQRSRSMSVSLDRVRVRGRSPAFTALAANFENPKDRNLSTPPPMIRKLYPKSMSPDSIKLAPKAAAIAQLTSTFEQPPPARDTLIPRSLRASSDASKSSPNKNEQDDSMNSRIESLTIQEDVKEGEGEAEADEGLPVYPYDRVNTASEDPVTDIDVSKREAYLSLVEFKEKLGMAKNEFYKLPKWKQNKLKMAVQLF